MKAQHRKKIVVISTITLEPKARVVRDSKNSRLFFEWMSVEKAALVMSEEIRKDKEHQFIIYLQYSKCDNIY